VTRVVGRVRGVGRLLRSVRAGTRDLPLPWGERMLLRWLVCLTVVVCNIAERNRHRVRKRVLETVLAYCCLTLAVAVAWVCRRTIRDRKAFGGLLLRARRVLLPRELATDLPLVVLSILWSDRRLTIVHTACVNFPYLFALARNTVHFLVSSYWAKLPIHFLWHRVLCILLDPFDRSDRVTWLGNTLAEVAAAHRHRQRGVFVNHNCFINEDQFPLVPPARSLRFDAVLNANSGEWKRHGLTRDIRSLAYITYSRDEEGRLIWPVASFRPAFMNDRYLDEGDRREIYAQACCGLALSACEGANYATGEFLLGGLPMVSTESTGGRDVWYSELNCIICEATPESVARAVRTWRGRHEASQVSQERIRAECVSRMQEHRERFVGALQDLFTRLHVDGSARVVFEEHRREDRLLHALSFQRTDSPHRHPFCQGKGWFPLTELPFD